MTTEMIGDAIGKVADPLFEKTIAELGYVRNISVDGAKATVELVLPTPAHPDRAKLEDEITAAAKAAGAQEVGLQVRAEVTQRVAGQGALGRVKNIIAVAAGKGGVGKSTVAVNLALALKSHGAQVGLLDADVYGPSQPTMLGEPEIPAGQLPDNRLRPAVYYGINVISPGFFVDPRGGVVWRGPMVGKLIEQFLFTVEWGELDYLVVDLPPGTGDAQLSLAQKVPVTGAVMVTTPQEIALIDVIKAVSMFQKVEIPILGVIENMSYYVCPGCGHQDDIFARGGGALLAKEIKAPLFGEIPIDAKIRFGGDAGRPIVIGAPDSSHAMLFKRIAALVAGEVARRNGPPSATAKRAAGLVQIR